MSYLCLKELILCPKGCLEVCLRYVLRFDVADRRCSYTIIASKHKFLALVHHIDDCGDNRCCCSLLVVLINLKNVAY
jgi:hypothetical protein